MRTIAILMAVAALGMALPWLAPSEADGPRLAQNVGLPPTPALNPRLGTANRVNPGGGAVVPGDPRAPMLDQQRLGAPAAGAVPPASAGAVQPPPGPNVPPQPGAAVAPPPTR